MQIDLFQLRSQLERELRELEQRRSALQDQLAHIDSVEQMAARTAGTGEEEGQETAVRMPEPRAPAPAEEGKSWFRR